jgi:hypothetical protein
MTSIRNMVLISTIRKLVIIRAKSEAIQNIGKAGLLRFAYNDDNQNLHAIRQLQFRVEAIRK